MKHLTASFDLSRLATLESMISALSGILLQYDKLGVKLKINSFKDGNVQFYYESEIPDEPDSTTLN